MNSVVLELKEFRAWLCTLGLLGLCCGADKVVKLLGTHSVFTLFNFHEIKEKVLRNTGCWFFLFFGGGVQSWPKLAQMRLRQCLTIVIFRTVAANWNRQWFDIADCLDLGLIQRIQWGLIFIWQTHTSTVVCTRTQSVWDFLKLSANGSLPRKKKEERIQWRWWQWWWWCIRKKQITKSAYTCVKKNK